MDIKFLAGLCRTGQTLLSTILKQNPKIYTETQSPLCELMWQTHLTCNHDGVIKEAKSSSRDDIEKTLLTALPKTYYKDVKQPIIIDRCKQWTSNINFNMASNYITSSPKMVVTIRPLEDIVKSLLSLKTSYGMQVYTEYEIFEENTNPLTLSLQNLYELITTKKEGKDYLLVNYNDLVDSPKKIITDIYSFYEIESYNHNFENIQSSYTIDDDIYGIKDIHKVDNKIIKKDKKDIELSSFALAQINNIQKQIKVQW